MRFPCIDVETYRLTESVNRIKSREQGNPNLPVISEPAVTEIAVADSERALIYLLNERRRINVANRLSYEEKAWSLIMRVLGSLDKMEEKDLMDTFSGQSTSRSIQAIESLTRSLGTLLKNLDLESNIADGGGEGGLSVLSDDELDELLNRSEARDMEIVVEPTAIAEIEIEDYEPRDDTTGEDGKISALGP